MTAANSPENLAVCHVIPSLAIGGAERQAVDTINELPQARKFLVVLTRSPPGTLTLDDCLRPAVTCSRLDARLRNLPATVVRVAHLLRKWRIDVVHTHLFYGNLVGVLAARIAQVPVVVTSEHGQLRWQNTWHRFLERKIVSPNVDMRLCVSQHILDLRIETRSCPIEKLVLFRNGTRIPKRSAAAHRNVDLPVIGTVGRMVEAKDYPNFLAALGIVRDRSLGFRAYMLGDGPEKSALQLEIRRLALESHVQLVGTVSDPSDWFEKFSIFVVSSKREGQPLALLEAMARGVPIVATAVGGIPETIEHEKDGLLVASGRPEELASAIIRLIGDPDHRERLGQSARQRAKNEHSLAARMRELSSLYSTLHIQKQAGPANRD